LSKEQRYNLETNKYLFLPYTIVIDYLFRSNLQPYENKGLLKKWTRKRGLKQRLQNRIDVN
jgi:hypothetical protein